MKLSARQILQAVLFGVAAVMLLNALGGAAGGQRPTSIPYSEFLTAVEAGNVRSVTMRDQEIVGELASGERFTSYAPDDPGLVGDLVNAGVSFDAVPPPQPSILGRILASLLPVLLIIGVLVWMMRRQSGAGGGQGIFGIGKSRARRVEGENVTVRLADVAGVDEAKEEVGELVAFLRDPERFRRLGGNIPRGVLMVGPPGTGKTLLARAIAGEAGVPFFSASGSDFVEMFVGVGASRVRDLFEQAKRSAPSIIFVDEIDAVGRRRGAGMGGGHDEREQTLNQMLVEMDGFEGGEGVIVVAATNRPDVLDPALLRPGRFDRQVTVPLPDVVGRAHILEIYMRKVPLAGDVEAETIARGTPGFSGADLANLVNEAALMAARASATRIDMDCFERAKDKILMGAERRSMVMTDDERRLTAYHEAGHAIVGRTVPEHDPVHKVSIIPRGRALGVTLFLPERDRLSASRQRLESQIASLFGGRVAEEIVFGDDAVTTGAQNDIERATRIARDMVTRWGLSDALGPLHYADESEGGPMFGPAPRAAAHSEQTAQRIDEEVRAIIDRNYALARSILTDHRDLLERMAQALVVHETITSDQIDALIDGRDLTPPDVNVDPRGGPPPASGEASGGVAGGGHRALDPALGNA